MTEAAKRHARTLLNLVNSQDATNGIIPLDLGNETHYGCVSAMFGGEEYFQSALPSHYHAAKEASRSPRADAPTSNQQGFMDIARVQYIAYNPGTDTIRSSCYANLTGRTSTLYQVMYLYKNGNPIGMKSGFHHDTNFAFMNMDIAPPLDGGSGGEVTVIAQASWKNAQNMMMSAVGFERRDERSVSLSSSISGITVNDPVHKKSASNKDINIAYGRSASDLDYSYPDVRLEKMQKIFLDISGTVNLKEGAVFVRGEPNSTNAVLNHMEMGTVWYLNNIKDSFFVKKSNTCFEWRFDYDWKNVIPSSIKAGTRSYAFDMILEFWAIAPGETTATKNTLYVSSYDQEPKPDNYVKISNIKLYWGCLAKGEPVTMSDGTTMPIEAIRTGDMVMGADRKPLRVTGVTTGEVSELLRVETECGQVIRATETHPFMTNGGMRHLIDLFIEDRLLTAEGTYARITSCYPCESDRVYNIDTVDDKPFICSGLVVGGFAAQNAEQDMHNGPSISKHEDTLRSEAEAWHSLFV